MFNDLSTPLTLFGTWIVGTGIPNFHVFLHLSTCFNHTPVKVMDFGNRAMPSRNWGFAIHPSLPSAGVVHLMLRCLGTSLILGHRGLSATHMKEPIMIDIVFAFGEPITHHLELGPGKMYS